MNAETETKRAPVQRLKGGIPWDMHMRAYAVYAKRHGEQKAMIEGWCRGGFAISELDMFIPGWRDELERIKNVRLVKDPSQPRHSDYLMRVPALSPSLKGNYVFDKPKRFDRLRT